MHDETLETLDLGHALIRERGVAPNGDEYANVCFCSEVLYVEFMARHSFLASPVEREVGSTLRDSYSRTASLYRLEGPGVVKALRTFCEEISHELHKIDVKRL